MKKVEKKKQDKKTTIADIRRIVEKFCDTNANNVQFAASFCTFKKDGDVDDFQEFVYGHEKSLQIAIRGLSGLAKQYVKEEKDEFVNI
jgi:hypothetical protein